jgi:hypothetical protein
MSSVIYVSLANIPACDGKGYASDGASACALAAVQDGAAARLGVAQRTNVLGTAATHSADSKLVLGRVSDRGFLI